MKVLIANVYYPPVSFGGATIVTEETTLLLSRKRDVECLVLCLDPLRPRPNTFLTRYVWNDVNVIAASAAADPYSPSYYQADPHSPSFNPYGSSYKRDAIAALNRNIIDRFSPDVALIHCVQDFGAQFVMDLSEAGVPVAIFVHDAWWICERQFMINAAGGYCFQTAIDLNVCRYCVDDIEQTRKRDFYLRSILNRADARLFPSKFFRDLHVASGIRAEQSIVVKNGVLAPKSPSSRVTPVGKTSPSVRFGFLGGLGGVKGADLIEAVFSTLPRSDYELVCVDNATNIGRRSVGFRNWRCTGKLRIREGFTRNTIDDFYDEIDVLLCPSQWKESFGLAVREALIRNKWVIVTDGGALAEDVIPGVNGTVIPLSPDPEFLKEAVLDCFIRDWSEFKNPHAHEIRTFAEQTEELYRVLLALSKRQDATRGPHAGVGMGRQYAID
jgi:O-antigen biosynthesis protein